MGKIWALEKEGKGKKEALPSLCEESFLRSLEMDWTRILWNFQNYGILKKCKKGSAGIGTTQGSILMDTRNEDRHVPSAAYGSEKG